MTNNRIRKTSDARACSLLFFFFVKLLCSRLRVFWILEKNSKFSQRLKTRNDENCTCEFVIFFLSFLIRITSEDIILEERGEEIEKRAPFFETNRKTCQTKYWLDSLRRGVHESIALFILTRQSVYRKNAFRSSRSNDIN